MVAVVSSARGGVHACLVLRMILKSPGDRPFPLTVTRVTPVAPGAAANLKPLPFGMIDAPATEVQHDLRMARRPGPPGGGLGAWAR